MTVIMNRNTSPKRPLTNEQLQDVVTQTTFNQYPDEELARFKSLYTKANDLNVDQIELANGSDEWLQKLVLQFGEGGVLTIDPDFYMYHDYSNQLNRDFYTVESDDDFNFDLDNIVEAINRIQPSLLFISNPQNPTGTQFSEDFLQTLADEMEKINGYFAIDEAYIEFGDNYKRPENENVIIVRTLSKIYGMAGLRIGIAIAKGETYEKMTEVNHPYPVNNLVLNVASELFKDTEKLNEWKSYQLACRDELVKSFDIVKDVVTVKETKANFVFTYGKAAASLADYLSEKGYLMRRYNQDNLDTVARYSIIDIEDYPDFKQALSEWRHSIG